MHVIQSADGDVEPNVTICPALIVLAKAPRPGRCKTRLTPPCTPRQAASLARAALIDTLAVAAAAPVSRRVLVLEGQPGAWLPSSFDVLPQRGRGLDERLEAAFADVGCPALLVGMDTPQLHAGLILDGLQALGRENVDAVLGGAEDGGYWSVGLSRPCPGAFAGVPMSESHTGAAQRARFRALGLRVYELPMLRDVDCIEDAHAVAALAPRSRFAAVLATVG